MDAILTSVLCLNSRSSSSFDCTLLFSLSALCSLSSAIASALFFLSSDALNSALASDASNSKFATSSFKDDIFSFRVLV